MSAPNPDLSILLAALAANPGALAAALAAVAPASSAPASSASTPSTTSVFDLLEAALAAMRRHGLCLYPGCLNQKTGQPNQTGLDPNKNRKLYCSTHFPLLKPCSVHECPRKEHAGLGLCLSCHIAANPDLYTLAPLYQPGAACPTPPAVVANAEARALADVDVARKYVKQHGCMDCGGTTVGDNLLCDGCFRAKPKCTVCGRRKAFGKGKTICATCSNL